MTEERAEFKYKDDKVVVTIQTKEARLTVEVTHSSVSDSPGPSHLSQVFSESAEASTAAFPEIKVNVVLENGSEQQCDATDVLKAARAGEKLVKEWNRKKFVKIADFTIFLPVYYVDAYLSWDLELGNQATVNTIRQDFAQDGLLCWMSLKHRKTSELLKLTRKAKTFIVMLTRSYLKMLEDTWDNAVTREVRLVGWDFSSTMIFVALDSEALVTGVSESLAKSFHESRVPEILDFTTVGARKQNYPRLLEIIRTVKDPHDFNDS